MPDPPGAHTPCPAAHPSSGGRTCCSSPAWHECAYVFVCVYYFIYESCTCMLGTSCSSHLSVSMCDNVSMYPAHLKPRAGQKGGKRSSRWKVRPSHPRTWIPLPCTCASLGLNMIHSCRLSCSSSCSFVRSKRDTHSCRSSCSSSCSMRHVTHFSWP
jgi:hypothetical protein